jgi:hypothetical protein
MDALNSGVALHDVDECIFIMFDLPSMHNGGKTANNIIAPPDIPNA